MKNLLFVVILIYCITSCNKKDELDVNLNNSGSITLTFTNAGNPVKNAAIRIGNSYGSEGFQLGNVFEGTTDENGNILVGPLNSGSYVFRLKLDSSNVYFLESFQIVSGVNVKRAYDIKDFSSDAKIEISNEEDLNLTGVNFYFTPDFIAINSLTGKQIKDESIQGSLSGSTISFSKIPSGEYKLLAFRGDYFINLSSRNGYSIQRDYDFETETSLPLSLIVFGRSFTINSTTDDQGIASSNSFKTVSFTSNEVVFTDQSDKSDKTNFLVTKNQEKYDISLGSIDLTGVKGISSFQYANNELTIYYYNNSFDYFYAYLK